MKVLVVDDEQLVRWFMERALKRKGHDVTVVSSIHEAEALLGNNDYDLVITDLKMPEGNGAILIEKLCEKTNRPDIIVCSAYITPELDREFKYKGIYTLKKPFKLSELEDTLSKVHF